MMQSPTPIDRAHAAMEAAHEDEAARRNFYATLVETELFVLLAEEAVGENLVPQLFTTESGTVTAVFDTEERLADFAGAAVPYAAMPGRDLVRMLAGQGLALGLNLEAAASATLLPPEVLDWIAGVLQASPRVTRQRPVRLAPPREFPQGLLSALDARLARAAGLARCAWLASVEYNDGAAGHILAFVDAASGAGPLLARTVAEAIAFAGGVESMLDVAFLDAGDPFLARLSGVALRFDLPAGDAARAATPAAPGMDPSRPPRLR